jgi:hypothetical protein
VLWKNWPTRFQVCDRPDPSLTLVQRLHSLHPTAQFTWLLHNLVKATLQVSILCLNFYLSISVEIAIHSDNLAVGD